MGQQPKLFAGFNPATFKLKATQKSQSESVLHTHFDEPVEDEKEKEKEKEERDEIQPPKPQPPGGVKLFAGFTPGSFKLKPTQKTQSESALISSDNKEEDNKTQEPAAEPQRPKPPNGAKLFAGFTLKLKPTPKPQPIASQETESNKEEKAEEAESTPQPVAGQAKMFAGFNPGSFKLRPTQKSEEGSETEDSSNTSNNSLPFAFKLRPTQKSQSDILSTSAEKGLSYTINIWKLVTIANIPLFRCKY